VWQLCSKYYTKLYCYVDVKSTLIRHVYRLTSGLGTWTAKCGLERDHNNYAREAIRNVYLEEKNKIKIIVHNHRHGIGKLITDKELGQNQCNADVGITTRTDIHHAMLLTMKLLNQGLKSSLWQFYGFHNDFLHRYGNICVANDHGYIPPVVNTSRSFLLLWHITLFAARLKNDVCH